MLFFGSVSGCNNENKAAPAKPAPEDTTLTIKKDTVKRVDTVELKTFPLIKYNRVYIKSAKQLGEIKRRFSKDTSTKSKFDPTHLLSTLNRKEYRFMRVGDTLIVPDTIVADIRAYSLFPQYYSDAKDIKKIIIVSNKYQCFACYEWGKLVRFCAANTGKETTPTYPGRYAMVWKERLRKSSLDETWIMPYTWNIHREAGSAFHQFELPGRPVSHSCVRQLMVDAKWLFSWGEPEKKDSITKKFIPLSGLPVLIIDLFDFSRKRGGPWWDLKSNKDGQIALPANPLQYEEALIPIKQIPKTSRGCLRNKQRYIYAEDTLRARGWIRPQVVIRESVDFNKLRKQKEKEKAKKKKNQSEIFYKRDDN